MSSVPIKEDQGEGNSYETTRRKWEDEYASFMVGEKEIRNRSGLKIKPLYSPEHISDPVDAHDFSNDLGFPGQYPYTRGVYSTMHRGRRWSQRQLIGLSSPEAFNTRQHQLLDSGSAAVSLIPCNSGFRGLDMDEVPRAILGTCGTLVNTVEDIEICLDEIPLETSSIGLNDPTPFTFAAFVLCSARKQGISWEKISGTSNQSDYLSHYVANHMFFRLALPGSRRVLGDHIEFMLKKVPRWNPLSVVGQHMQQAGATPAEAMAFTLCSAIQHAQDCRERGIPVDDFLPRFSFFFDISISFFEEIAKFRAGRRIWAKIARERFGAESEAAMRLRFHAQTSGADLTRQQPMNNISRVAIQGMAGIFGGLQSLHTDAWDEALSSPTEQSAKLASATQNILSNEAGLADVIDPLGGSYYLEHLTDEMENKIASIISEVDAAGGMCQAVQDGLVQSWIGRSALKRQQEIDSGEQKIVGVNLHVTEESAKDRQGLERPSENEIDRCLERLKSWKASRNQTEVNRELNRLAKVAAHPSENVFEQVIESAAAGATHGEIVRCLRDVLGFGQPRVQV
jgi:methylmalonyl-CoA mutase N-terminal domain/subunit